jgi:tetratricopeptide (TPR) repeat protein
MRWIGRVRRIGRTRLARLAGIILAAWLLFFGLPRVYHLLLLVDSEYLFHEARRSAESVKPAGNRAIAMAHIARALIHARQVSRARYFAEDAPLEVQFFALHEMGHALLDQNRLDDALELARYIHRRFGSFHASNEMISSAPLFQRLAKALLDAGRYQEALEVVLMLKSDDRLTQSNPQVVSDYLRVVALRAAENGQLDIVIKAIRSIPKLDSISMPWFWLSLLAAKRGDWQTAAEWLQHHKKDFGREERLFEKLHKPLPPSWRSDVERVNQLARSGQRQRALRLAETILRHYLLQHTEKTIDYDELAYLTARLTQSLPADAMHSVLERLPLQRYECAVTHLETGIVWGLALAGHQQDLARILPTIADPYLRQDAYRLLLRNAMRQGGFAQVERWLRLIPDAYKEGVQLELAVQLAQQGRPREAQRLLQPIELPSLEDKVAKRFTRLNQPPFMFPTELSQSIYRLVKSEPQAMWWLISAGWHHNFPTVATTRPQDQLIILQAALSIAHHHILKQHDVSRYHDLLLIVRHKQQSPDARLEIFIDYVLQEMTQQALYQRFYDPLLGEAAQSYEDAEWYYPRQKYLVYAASAAARMGRLSEAERLRREAGRVHRSLNTIYEAGYAVGLAVQGHYRAAAWRARGISDPEWRAYALAEIAAEMKKRGM